MIFENNAVRIYKFGLLLSRSTKSENGVETNETKNDKMRISIILIIANYIYKKKIKIINETIIRIEEGIVSL